MRLESDEEEKIRDLNPTAIRIPSMLKAKLKAAAKESRHSMNAEIVSRLEASFSSYNDNKEMSRELGGQEALALIDDEAIRNDLRKLFDELSSKLIEEIKNKK